MLPRCARITYRSVLRQGIFPRKFDNLSKIHPLERGFMLPFREPALEDREAVEKCAAAYNYPLCEHCFVDVFIWQGHYHTRICFYEGFLLIKMTPTDGAHDIYLAPIGEGNLRSAVEALQADAVEQGIPFLMVSVAEDMLPRLEEAMPNAFSYSWSEDGADYIYLSEKLQTLSGKKLQSKRNLVNRFKANYDGRWAYEDLTEENIHEVFDFHMKWIDDNHHLYESDFLGETCAISLALRNFTPLGLRGGILRLDGKIIAFTLGKQSTPDMFVMQIEKADHTIPGAYQMINQQFALHNCTDVTYINREEDLGIDGLRQAKRSYQPVMLAKKYTAVPK
ncbi:DUF2156 domain-containing protein [Butyricicoccus sp. 1XD8-22]|nr:DUF2156 domain-containing protein [Butyricicoccus sp. 1XD8-22]